MILKQRDLELLSFDWIEPSGVHVTSVNKAARHFLPLDFKGEATDAALWKWLNRRIVPRNRAHVQDMLLKFGLDPHDTRGVIHLCRGLSLNDVDSVVEDDFKGKWKDFNLYGNEFSTKISSMAFTGGGSYARPNWTSSPEFTTNGMLAKCWRRIDGKPVLFKSGTTGAANAGFEPYSEFYASQIADAMGLPHVTYGLSKFKGMLCSTCQLFTSDKYGFIPAGRLLDPKDALGDPCCADMFFFDAVIFNTDRHLGNFGYLVDNDTNEIVGAAPIFDNGYGLFSLALHSKGANNEFNDLRKFTSRIHPALYAKWLGISGGITPSMIERLQRLSGFRFKRHENYNLPLGRLRAIEDFLQNRISKICEFLEKADNFIDISSNHVVVKSRNAPAHVVVNAAGTDSILDNMRADPFITAAELAPLLGVTPRTVQRRIEALLKAGRIERVGSDKSGNWHVKY